MNSREFAPGAQRAGTGGMLICTGTGVLSLSCMDAPAVLILLRGVRCFVELQWVNYKGYLSRLKGKNGRIPSKKVRRYIQDIKDK